MRLYKILIILISLISISNAENNRIINGLPAAGNFKFMASLLISRGNGYYFTCGATFLDSQHLLTAAHCVDQGGNFIVGYNNNNLTDQSYIPVDSYSVHPKYNVFNLNNDFAVLKLVEPASPGAFVTLPTKRQFKRLMKQAKRDRAFGRILGWGTVSVSESLIPVALQTAVIPVWEQRECKVALGSFFKSRTMICGGILSSNWNIVDGVDSCYGDSGGPWVVETKNGVMQVGVVSWGFDCATYNTPGVYSKVVAARNWILSKL